MIKEDYGNGNVISASAIVTPNHTARIKLAAFIQIVTNEKLSEDDKGWLINKIEKRVATILGDFVMGYHKEENAS